jgi:hypothetical protein
MLEWDKEIPSSFLPDGTLHDYDRRFAAEEQYAAICRLKDAA